MQQKNKKYMHMKLSQYLLLIFLILGSSTVFKANGQTKNLGDELTKKVGMYVFPAKGQSAEQLQKDESDCYTWAVQQSGVDPLSPPKVEAAQVNTGPDGSAVRGAAGGAAVGAAIGAICGDAGKGAAIGAVGGALRGRRASRMGHAVEQQANNQAATQTQEELMNSFKKAYSVCLEGKGYTVK